jgi:peptidoglycan hydrolase-like amidase
VRWKLAIAALLLARLVIPTSAAASPPEHVRIAVMGLFHSSQFGVEVSPSSPMLVDSGQRQFVAGVDARQSIAIARSGRKIIVRTGGSQIIGENITFSARQGGECDFVLAVPGKLHRHYRGKLIVTVGNQELLTVVEMELETAAASVVAAESPGDAPLEAMKAQAVVSRSYLVSGGRHHPYADFCDTTHCQFLREPPPAGSRAALATRATKGQVLTWQGKPFPAMYSASCGGHTHSLAQVGASAVDYPYFPVECPYCQHSPEHWSSRLSKSDAAALVSDSEQERIKAVRKLGWMAIPSSTFTRTDVPGAVTLQGVGRGHGVGLCQRGASSMAQNGKDFRAILSHYFPNATLGYIRSALL